MKRPLFRITALIAAALLLLCALPTFALETTSTSKYALWASPAKYAAAQKPVSAVKWWYGSRQQQYFLFLPAEADPADLQVWITGASYAVLDGEAYLENGAVTAGLTEGYHTLQFDDKVYPVTVMHSANIPAMYLTTATGSMAYVHANKNNNDTGALLMVNANGKIVYNNALTQIKGRGNATWGKPKKPYQIKLSKSTALVEAAGKSKTWLLLANYTEASLIRNKIAFDLAYDAGLINSSQSQFVDLYCNNEYMGTYQLCEKVQINSNRIEINDLEGDTEDVNDQALDSYPRFGPNAAETGSVKGYEIPNNPADITGGYLLELEYRDRYEAEVSGFVTSRGQPVTIKSPEYASREQAEYIAGYFQEFEDALYADDGVNPTTGKRYDEYFDLTSLARKYIVEELTKNIDANVTSQYFYKPSDRESTVGYCGPVWDYDNAMGNYGSSFTDAAVTTTGIYAAARKGYTYYFNKLYQFPEFLDAVRAEWQSSYLPSLREFTEEGDAIEGNLVLAASEYFARLCASADMNYVMWEKLGVTMGAYLNTGNTYAEAVEYLRSWISNRANYLSSIWSSNDIAARGVSVPTESAQRDILDYNGAASAYTVSGEEGLRKVAELINRGETFKNVTLLQTADITLTEPFIPGGMNEPGGSSPYFRGTYDGQGFSIYNLQINCPEQNGVAIFGSAKGATFRDMHVASGNVVGYNRAAAIAGYGDSCTFIRCSNSADITSLGGSDGTAGIAGVARYSAKFYSCYNTGNITAVTAPAGIAGWGQANIELYNCYTCGVITGNSGSPLARTNNQVRDFTTCYYLEGSCAHADVSGASTFTEEALTGGALTALLNEYSPVWLQGEQFPLLKTDRIAVKTVYYAGAEEVYARTVLYEEGAQVFVKEYGNPFFTNLRWNGAPLEEAAFTPAASGVLEADLAINAKAVHDYTGQGSYFLLDVQDLSALLARTAAGDDCTGSTFYLLNNLYAAKITQSGGLFNGTLNGKFSHIYGLSVPLFETVGARGDVRKLCFFDADVQGEGVVAEVNNGKIAYITTENIVLRGMAPGGVAGQNSGIINACSTGGFVMADTAAAGITGSNTGTVKNCINHARIFAPSGTAAGIAAANSGTVTSCVNRGMLNGADKPALAPAATGFYWSWCAGTGGGTAVTDAAMASEAFLENLPALYWVQGEKAPAPVKHFYELGDANGDDQVSVADAVHLLRYFNDIVPEDQINLAAAHITDSSFGMGDLIRLLQYLNGLYDI